jgi:DNA invertase Pin-like site-specific DNA recombinase
MKLTKISGLHATPKGLCHGFGIKAVTVHDLAARGVGLKVLTGQGASTLLVSGQVAFDIFSIFSALAEFEHELKVERITAVSTPN